MVDDDVVVEPAQQDESFRVVVAAVSLVNNVVGFESVAGGAAVRLAAATVAVEHEVPDALRDPVPISGYGFQAVSVDEGRLSLPDTEDLAEGVGPDLEA